MHVHIYAFAGMAFCVSKHSKHSEPPTGVDKVTLPHLCSEGLTCALTGTKTAKHSRPHFVNSNMQILALSPTHIHIYIHGNTRTYIYLHIQRL